MKIHYSTEKITNYSVVRIACDESALAYTRHSFVCEHQGLPPEATRIRSKVTCGNCKRSKLFRKIK